MRATIVMLSIALLTITLPASARPGNGPGAQAGGGRPAMSHDDHRRDGEHRRDATNRTRKDAHERGSLHRADPETKGDDTATMRSRRDERKAIQGDYRGSRDPGQEGTGGETDPKKKPWWKFWSR